MLAPNFEVKKLGNNHKLPKFIYCIFEFIYDLGYKCSLRLMNVANILKLLAFLCSKMPALTPAEKMRRYRESIKANTEFSADICKEERQRKKSLKKSIADSRRKKVDNMRNSFGVPTL